MDPASANAAGTLRPAADVVALGGCLVGSPVSSQLPRFRTRLPVYSLACQYPVGYRATKVVFGKTYEMSIEEGETGPVFCVQDTVSGKEWRGETPTNPWTAVCIHQNTGQRISGPKFFGFSDLFTLKALAKNLYNEEELAAAVSGSVTFNQNMTEEELRAKEFCDKINGCGPKMAEILAREDVTGAADGRPKSLPELAAWARLHPDNRKKLYLWLTTSDCIPEKTRRWSVWYKSIAHRITDGIANTTE